MTSPQPAPAGPSAGNGPAPKIRTGDSAICASTQPTNTVACKLILPVPRTALPSRLSTQMHTAPPSATLAYASASDSISSCPPIQRNMNGAPNSSEVEKIAPSRSANTRAWKTRSSARSRRPAPRARATADDTPLPMPLLVVCRTSITQGNASEAPASALVPMRPRKNPSNVITPANASKLRTFGAARRSSVGKIGPSSRSLVRAAVDGVTLLAAADDGGEIEMLALFIGNSCFPRAPAALRVLLLHMYHLFSYMQHMYQKL